jgi:hypothetical protein
VVNISEPDALVDLVAYRYFYPQNAAEVAAMTNAVIRLLCNVEAAGGTIVKGRSFAIELGDLFHTLFPRAKQIFLYRDAKSYMFSALRAFDDGVQRSEGEMQQLLAGIQTWLTPLVPSITQLAPQEQLGGAGLVAHSVQGLESKVQSLL